MEVEEMEHEDEEEGAEEDDEVDTEDNEKVKQLNPLPQIKPNLEDEAHPHRQILERELKQVLEDKEEELEGLKDELDKERSKSAALQDNLDKEKERRLKLEKRIEQFERFVTLGMKTFFGGGRMWEGTPELNGGSAISIVIKQEADATTQTASASISSSSFARMSATPPVQVPNAVTVKQPGIVNGTGKPAQQLRQNLKRKFSHDEEPKVPPKSGPGPLKQLPKQSVVPPAPSESQTGTTPDLPTLPPLVFQFQANQIKMGMFVDGRPQILKNESGSESTPFIVGVTTEGNLEYGEGVTSFLYKGQPKTTAPTTTTTTFWKYWWVTQQLLKFWNDAWSTNAILHDGERHKITVEFLIGFILKRLKTHVETEMKGSCSTAVITVPFWYSSSQRIQVKDGVRLAGFTQVFLINEGPAAAFACPSRDNMISASHNILVLSENSHQIDASIYSYNSYTSSGAKRLIMIGHSGHYSQVDPLVDGTEPLRAGDKEEAIVQKICKWALKNMQEKKHNAVGDTSPPVELITISESKIWGPILEQVGKQFVTTFHNLDVDSETAVVMGAAILSQKPEEIQTIISDKLAHDVLAKCDHERANISIIPKENVGLARNRVVTHTFPSQCQNARIFQVVQDRPVDLFRMTIQRSIPPDHRIAISLTVTNEGIVKFRDLAYTSTYRNNSSVKPARLEDYSWKAPNLSLESLIKARALLEFLPKVEKEIPPPHPSTPPPQPGLSSPVEDAKQALIQKCVEMKEQLEEGDGSIPFTSNSVKKSFIKTMQSAISIAENPDATMEEVQGQMESVEKWRSEYMSSNGT